MTLGRVPNRADSSPSRGRFGWEKQSRVPLQVRSNVKLAINYISLRPGLEM